MRWLLGRWFQSRVLEIREENIMTKQQLKQLIKTDIHTRSLDAWLIRNVCNHVGCPPFDSLDDITRHGCESGCVPELIYTTDCLHFYQRFEANIWDIIRTFLEDTGQSLGQFLDGFSSDIQDEITFKVKLTWFAVEETAHKLACRLLPY
jgi:hypothetical protein